MEIVSENCKIIHELNRDFNLFSVDSCSLNYVDGMAINEIRLNFGLFLDSQPTSMK